MSYNDLTDEMLIKLAESIPQRTLVQSLHEYVRTTRQLVNGDDQLSIPDSHLGHMRAENHEGSLRLNARIEDLAAWFARAQSRFILKAPGPGQEVRRSASVQERFARRGETELMRGTTLHNWRDETLRDFAEVGVSIVQQHHTSDYYQEVQRDPDKMRTGSKLTELVFNKRIDPAAFGWIEDEQGDFGANTVAGTRHLGEIARIFGIEAAEKALGYFDFGIEIDPDDIDAIGASATIETTEVWGANDGALIIMGGPNPNDSFKQSTIERIVKRWTHNVGRPRSTLPPSAPGRGPRRSTP